MLINFKYFLDCLQPDLFIFKDADIKNAFIKGIYAIDTYIGVCILLSTQRYICNFFESWN